MVTWGGGGGGGPTPLYGQYGKCAAGQSTVTEKNLATLDTNLSHSVLNNRLPNNTQITTNNISGLLCRSRPLRFIEDQLSLKKQNCEEYIKENYTEFWIRIYKRQSEARKNPYKKTRERREKHGVNLGRNQAQKTPRPSYEAEKITIIKRKYIHHIYR